MAGGLLSAFLQYELIWDFYNYHYYAGFSFLNGRLGYDLSPAFQMTYGNPLLDTVTYLTATIFDNHVFAYHFVSGLYFGALLYVLFLLNGLFFDLSSTKGKISVAVSMTLGVTGFATWFQIGSCTGEIPVSVLVLSGLYVLIRHCFVLKDVSGKHFLLAGFLLGSAAGLKLTAALYCLSAGLCVPFCLKRRPRPFTRIGCFILGGIAGFLVFDGFWMYALYREYQNPIFPFFNAFFKSPWFPEINTRDTIHTAGRGWIHFLLFPLMTIGHSADFPVAGLCSFTDFRFLFLFVLLIVFCFRLFKKKDGTREQTKFLILFVLFSYLVWLTFFCIIRYTVPMENVAGILFVLAFFSGKRTKRAIIAGTVCVVLLLGTPFFSDKWTVSGSSTVTDMPDAIETSDDVLVLLLTPTTSSAFVGIAKKYPKARAVGLFAPELIYWGTNATLTEYGKFKEKTDKILAEHRGDVIAIYVPRYLLGKKVRKIIENEDCFGAFKFIEINGVKVKAATNDLRICKISKKTDQLLNAE